MEQLRCLVCQGQSIADFGRRTCRRHARSRPTPDRRWGAAGRDPCVAYPALWHLDQLQADRRASCVATVACANLLVASRSIADQSPRPGERPVMGWIILLALMATSLGISGCFASEARASRQAPQLCCSVARAMRSRADRNCLERLRRAWKRLTFSRSRKRGMPSLVTSRRRKAGSACPRLWLAMEKARMRSGFFKMRSSATPAPLSCGSDLATRLSTMLAESRLQQSSPTSVPRRSCRGIPQRRSSTDLHWRVPATAMAH